MPDIQITVAGYRCTRCGWDWIPQWRRKARPKVCPACKSPYWDVERGQRLGRPKKIDPSAAAGAEGG